MATITMSARIKVFGSLGDLRPFITQEQYEYTAEEYRMIDNPYVEKEFLNKYMNHYKVTIDGSDFWIPQLYAVPYDKPYPLHTTDKKLREYDKYSNDAAKDVKKQYKDMLGRTINNTYRREVSWLYAKLLKGNRIDAPLPGENDTPE